MEVPDECAFPFSIRWFRGRDRLRDARHFYIGKRAGDVHAHTGKFKSARVVSGREVRFVHSLGRVQRVGRRGMDHGNEAHQSHRLRKAAGIFQSHEV